MLPAELHPDDADADLVAQDVRPAARTAGSDAGRETSTTSSAASPRHREYGSLVERGRRRARRPMRPGRAAGRRTRHTRSCGARGGRARRREGAWPRAGRPPRRRGGRAGAAVSSTWLQPIADVTRPDHRAELRRLTAGAASDVRSRDAVVGAHGIRCSEAAPEPRRPQRGGQSQWRTTRRWAASPRSGTPSTGVPASAAGGELYYEELMGEEGFSLRLLAALPPQHPVDRRASTATGASATSARRPTTRCCRGTSSRTTSSRPRRSRTPTSSRAGGSCSATATSGSPTPSPGATSPWYRNGIGDECVYVERGRARVETVFGAFEVGEGDYVVIPRATTHRWIPTRSGRGPAAH